MVPFPQVEGLFAPPGSASHAANTVSFAVPQLSPSFASLPCGETYCMASEVRGLTSVTCCAAACERPRNANSKHPTSNCTRAIVLFDDIQFLRSYTVCLHGDPCFSNFAAS